MQEFVEILGLILASATKFFLAPSLAVYLGYGLFRAIMITTLGGVLGFFIFFKFGLIIYRWYSSLFRQKNKPKFSRKNRIIVKIKSKYGLWGLAILTPCLLSIPIGAFLASRYYSKDKRTFPIFIVFIIIWSILLSAISVSIANESI